MTRQHREGFLEGVYGKGRVRKSDVGSKKILINPRTSDAGAFAVALVVSAVQ